MISKLLMLFCMASGSLLHAMQKQQDQVQAPAAVSALPKFLKQTYFALLPSDLLVMLKDTLSNEPSIYSALLSAKEPLWIEASGDCYDICFDAAGKRVVTTTNRGIAEVWCSQTGSLLATCDSKKQWGIMAACFNHSGDILVTMDQFGYVFIWDAKDYSFKSSFSTDAEHILSKHGRDRNSLALNAKGDRIVVIAQQGWAQLWNSDGSLIAPLEHPGFLHASSHKAGDKVVTYSADGTAKIWNMKDGSLLATLTGHSATIRSAKFNGPGDLIVTASDDGIAKIWKADGTLHASLVGHEKAVVSASFNPAQELVLTCSEDGTANLWKFDGSLLRTFGEKDGDDHYGAYAQFNEKGDMIYFTICMGLWRVSDGELIANLGILGRRAINGFTPSGDLFASSVAFHRVSIHRRPSFSLAELIGIYGKNTVKMEPCKIKQAAFFVPIAIAAGVQDGDIVRASAARRALCLSSTTCLKLIDFTHAPEVITKELQAESSIAVYGINPQGTHVMALSSCGMIFAWDVRDLKKIVNVEVKGEYSFSQGLFRVGHLSVPMCVGYPRAQATGNELLTQVIDKKYTLTVVPGKGLHLAGNAPKEFNCMISCPDLQALTAAAVSSDGGFLLVRGLPCFLQIIDVRVVNGSLPRERIFDIIAATKHRVCSATTTAWSYDGEYLLCNCAGTVYLMYLKPERTVLFEVMRLLQHFDRMMS